MIEYSRTGMDVLAAPTCLTTGVRLATLAGVMAAKESTMQGDDTPSSQEFEQGGKPFVPIFPHSYYNVSLANYPDFRNLYDF